tara:strand:- start:1186 stop:1362 length:177 start_codon:yes stop_codon:yes gene_type:complete
MGLLMFALASSSWDTARFKKDSFALIELGILVSLPIILLKDKAQLKIIWTNENGLSSK